MRLADRCAIQRHGLRAKTNFNYTRAELIQMLIDIKRDVNANINSKTFSVKFIAFTPREVQQLQNPIASDPDMSHSISAGQEQSESIC